MNPAAPSTARKSSRDLRAGVPGDAARAELESSFRPSVAGQANRQAPEAAVRIGGLPLPASGLEPVIGEASQQRLERNPQLHAGQTRSQAEVDAEPEREMRVRVA